MAITRKPASPRARRGLREHSSVAPSRQGKAAKVSRALTGPAICVLVFGTIAAMNATAETWHITPSVSIDETLTDNVNLDSSATAKSDLVTQIIPGFSVVEKGAHTSLTGSVSLPMLIYVRTGGENDKVYPNVNLVGNVEAVEKFFYIDAIANVSQEYLSPFGARPGSLVTTSANRYTTQTYTLSPYLRGVSPGSLSYELRDTNTWTKGTQSAVSTNDSYTNDAYGKITRDPVPWGWSVEFDRSSVKFPDQEALVTQIERVRLSNQIDPQVQVFGGAGYEDDHYIFADFHDATYNLGVHWRPTDRTQFDADWEHRFFGSSYHVVFDHRRPLSVWTLRASRDVTTYPQQVAGLPGGLNVETYLNQLFLTSIPDPVQRAAFIAQIIQNGGLPLFLAGGVNLYTQQATVLTSANASVGLLGARNSIFFSIYRLRNEPVATATGSLPDSLARLNNNTQTGAGITWTHNLTPSLSLNTSADLLRTVANPPLVGTTKQGTFRTALTTPISTGTTVYAGARYQVARSDVIAAYHEAAVFVGLTHVFH
jgi:uncharacterized protein (PEP-CTERM system associated)